METIEISHRLSLAVGTGDQDQIVQEIAGGLVVKKAIVEIMNVSGAFNGFYSLKLGSDRIMALSEPSESYSTVSNVVAGNADPKLVQVEDDLCSLVSLLNPGEYQRIVFSGFEIPILGHLNILSRVDTYNLGTQTAELDVIITLEVVDL